jgi:hypothetical protein
MVAQLLTSLRSIPSDILSTFDPMPSPQPPPDNVTEISIEDDAEKLDEERVHLLNEIAYYRDICAQLRCRYEQCTVLLNTAEKTKNGEPSPSQYDDTANNSLLVTRF